MGLSMQPLSQARLEASGRSPGGLRSFLRPRPPTCGAGESEPHQDPTFNSTCPTSRQIVFQEGLIFRWKMPLVTAVLLVLLLIVLK